MPNLVRGNRKYWLLLTLILLALAVYIAQAIIPESPEPITADSFITPADIVGEASLLPEDFSATFAPTADDTYALFRVSYWAVVEQTTTGRSTDISGTVTVMTGAESGISGQIQVDLRPLDAGSDQINALMHDDVLMTADYPYAILTPDTIEGLPDTLQTNTIYPVTIIGELTLREVTFPVRFDARFMLESADSLVIGGVAEVSRTIYELSAPQPFDSSLAETVTLAFQLTGARVPDVDG